VKFTSEYGFPFEFIDLREQPLLDLARAEGPKFLDRLKAVSPEGLAFVELPPSLTAVDDIYVPQLLSIQEDLQEVWDGYAGGNINEAVEEVRVRADQVVSGLRPDIQLRDGAPVLTLPISTLYGFMLMETALVITGGAQVMRCDNCSIIFVTGQGTGRRNTAKYCSNRCRVAAQRREALK
jgi:hypothetical protein